MAEILRDLGRPALARAVAANLQAFFLELRRSPGTAFVEGGGVARWHTPVPHPWFNAALARRPFVEGAVIGETVAFFRAHGVGSATWWLDPDIPADGWRAALIAAGFVPDERTPGMAVALGSLVPPPAPPDLTVEPVVDAAGLETWVAVFLQGYELPAAWAPGLIALLAGLGLDPPLRHYLGRLDGEPVATSSLFLGAGVAGVQLVATAPPARGRGVGAALTVAPLLDARALGYRAGILQSSRAGYGVYRRLGFEDLGPVAHFAWRSA